MFENRSLGRIVSRREVVPGGMETRSFIIGGYFQNDEKEGDEMDKLFVVYK
jgi:hypothetical protein